MVRTYVCGQVSLGDGYELVVELSDVMEWADKKEILKNYLAPAELFNMFEKDLKFSLASHSLKRWCSLFHFDIKILSAAGDRTLDRSAIQPVLGVPHIPNGDT